MSLAVYASPFTTEPNKNKKRISTISNAQTELANLEKDSDEQKEKNKLVLNLMSKLRPDNDGSSLENFEPLNNKPSNHSSLNEDVLTDKKEGMDNSQPSNIANNSNIFSPNNLHQEKLSDFKDTYNGRITYRPKKTVEGLGNGDGLAEKINYMIHLLEQQQAEKTDNIMEEFVLYAMLGVFVIFTVDSFTRAGRYVR
jgi:hypothetical protein